MNGGLYLSLLFGIATAHCGGNALPRSAPSGPETGNQKVAASPEREASPMLPRGAGDASGDRIEDIVFDDESLGTRVVSCDDPGALPAGVPCAPSRLLCELGVDRYRPCDELYMGDLLPELGSEPQEVRFRGPLPMLPIFLFQMKEPPLHARNRTEPVEAYRVTMKSWAFVDVMRLERNGDQGPGLAIRKLAERGPSNLWIHTRQITAVDPDTWREVTQLFADTDLWNGDRHRSQDVGKDGYDIYLEGIGNGDYQSVARWGPTRANGTLPLVDFLHRFFEEHAKWAPSQTASGGSAH